MIPIIIKVNKVFVKENKYVHVYKGIIFSINPDRVNRGILWDIGKDWRWMSTKYIWIMLPLHQ